MTERSDNLSPRWSDDFRDAIQRFVRVLETALGGRGNGFDPNETTLLLTVLATFLAIIVAAALWERL